MKVAIHFDKGRTHTGTWALAWKRYCEEARIEHDVVNCYDNGFLDEVDNYSLVLWHFSHYSYTDLMFARSILLSVKGRGVKVFPDFCEFWHFDDKVAQDFFLKALNVRMPGSNTFFDHQEIENWLAGEPHFPKVAKLKCGSGSQNVRLLRNAQDVRDYANLMFRGGVSASPSLLFKAKSNIRSAKDVKDFYRRFRRIPDFINTLRKSRSLPKEKGYVYMQDFIPNEGFDLKVVVVGDKASFFVRKVRAGDFRASGGADFFYDKSYVTPEVLQLCFEASAKLGSRCMGFDIVMDNNNGKPYIIEMCYGFSYKALYAAGGYWDSSGHWFDSPLDAPVEVLKQMALV